MRLGSFGKQVDIQILYFPLNIHIRSGGTCKAGILSCVLLDDDLVLPRDRQDPVNAIPAKRDAKMEFTA